MLPPMATRIMAWETSPADQPPGGACDDPSVWQDLEALLVVAAAHHLDDAVDMARHVHEIEPVIGAVCEQVFDPWPALADALEYRFEPALSGMSALVRWTIRRRPSVSTAIWRLRATIFLAALNPGICARSLDRHAVDHAGARALLAACRSRSTINSMSRTA